MGYNSPMSAIQGRPGASAATAKRCVVLCPAADEPRTQQLLRALGRRGLAVVLVTDPPRAMLELARYGALALIVADPDRFAGPGAAELVDAVRAYRPRTVCWQYADRKLAPINGRLGGVRLAGGGGPGASSADRLRAEHPRLSKLVVHAQPRRPDDGEPLVSEEELAMLLGPMLDDAAMG